MTTPDSAIVDQNVSGPSTPKRRVLHVGCGWLTIAAMPHGFQDGRWEEVRFDIDPNMSPDVIGTITDMSAVADGSVDAVYSSHNIEHVETFEVVRTLAEFRRVLKPGGFAAITCPDILSIAETIVGGNLDGVLYQSSAGPISPLDVLYGFGDDIRKGRHYMAHRTGFTQQTLSRRLAEAGFAANIVRRRPQHYDLWALATRDPVSEPDITALLSSYGVR